MSSTSFSAEKGASFMRVRLKPGVTVRCDMPKISRQKVYGLDVRQKYIREQPRFRIRSSSFRTNKDYFRENPENERHLSTPYSPYFV